ncbi:Uncharacterised protein [Neisseria subflava]|nr:Uncharacterised protein [Neisseria subflava]
MLKKFVLGSIAAVVLAASGGFGISFPFRFGITI